MTTVALDLGTSAARVMAEDAPAPRTRRSSPGPGPALVGGIVVDPDAAGRAIRPLLAAGRALWPRRVRVLACAPTGSSPGERAALLEAIHLAGAARVALAPEPLAAAIGAGLDPGSPYGQAVVDVGEGVTECAVVRAGAIVAAEARREGCAALRAAVSDHLLAQHGLRLERAEAERVARTIGLAGAPGLLAIRGSAADGSAASLRVSVDEIRRAMRSRADRIVSGVAEFLRGLPAPLAAETIESGLRLCGGGALLPGFARLLGDRTGVAVTLARDPLGAVVRGAHAMLPAAAATGLFRG